MADQKLFELIHEMTGYTILDSDANEIIQVAKDADVCRWTREGDSGYNSIDLWETGCGDRWGIDKGESLKSDGINYCPICGCKVKSDEGTI